MSDESWERAELPEKDPEFNPTESDTSDEIIEEIIEEIIDEVGLMMAFLFSVLQQLSTSNLLLLDLDQGQSAVSSNSVYP